MIWYIIDSQDDENYKINSKLLTASLLSVIVFSNHYFLGSDVSESLNVNTQLTFDSSYFTF